MASYTLEERFLPATMRNKLTQPGKSTSLTAVVLYETEAKQSKEKAPTAQAPSAAQPQDTLNQSQIGVRIGDLIAVNDVHGEAEHDELSFKAKPGRHKTQINREEVAGILQALPPNTAVEQIGDTIASNIVRKGGKHTAKKITFEA